MNNQKTSVTSYLERKMIENAMKEEIKKSSKPVLTELDKLKKENEKLKKRVKELEDEINGKYSNVRVQLQMLSFLTDIYKLIEGKSLNAKGEFFSVLLNRHPKRIKQRFSPNRDLFFSKNKGEAKLLKTDLLTAKKAYEVIGASSIVKKIEEKIDALPE